MKLVKPKPIVYPNWRTIAEQTRLLLNEITTKQDISEHHQIELKSINLLFRRRASWDLRTRAWLIRIWLWRPKKRLPKKMVALDAAIKMVLPELLAEHIRGLLHFDDYEELIRERVIEVISTDSLMQRLREADKNYGLIVPPKPVSPKPPEMTQADVKVYKLKPKPKEKKNGSKKTSSKKTTKR